MREVDRRAELYQFGRGAWWQGTGEKVRGGRRKRNRVGIAVRIRLHLESDALIRADDIVPGMFVCSEVDEVSRDVALAFASPQERNCSTEC